MTLGKQQSNLWPDLHTPCLVIALKIWRNGSNVGQFFDRECEKLEIWTESLSFEVKIWTKLWIYFSMKKRRKEIMAIVIYIASLMEKVHDYLYFFFVILFIFQFFFSPFSYLKIFHFSNFKYKNNFFFSKNSLLYHYTNFKSNYKLNF